MDSPKSEPSNWAVAGGVGDWYGQALLVGFMIAIGAFLEIGFWWGTLERLPLSALLWVSLVPVHGAGTGAVLWMCWLRLPAGKRCAALFIEPFTLGRNWWRVWVGVPLLYGGMAVLTLLTALALRRFGYTPRGIQLLHLLRSRPPLTPVLGLSLFASVLLVAPFTEEILFRVVLFEAFRGLGDVWAATAAAVVFAALHMVPEQFFALFVLGFVLQFLRLRTGSLLPCILVHAGINIIGLVALLLTVT